MQMTPEQLNERMAFAMVVNEQPEEQDGISADDPEFERKFFGR